MSRYDLALALVPLPLLAGLLVGEILPLSPRMGVSVGAVLSAIVVGHLLFGDPPTQGRPPTRRGPRDGVNEPSG